jgi:hypothetical protein
VTEVAGMTVLWNVRIIVLAPIAPNVSDLRIVRLKRAR